MNFKRIIKLTALHLFVVTIICVVWSYVLDYFGHLEDLRQQETGDYDFGGGGYLILWFLLSLFSIIIYFIVVIVVYLIKRKKENQTMKYTLLFYLILSSIAACQSQTVKHKEKNYLTKNNTLTSIPIVLTVKINSAYKLSTMLNSTPNVAFLKSKGFTDCLDLTINIKNTSNKVLYLCMMSCSWGLNFTSNSIYYLGEQNCNKNIPKLIEVQPQKSVIYKGTSYKKSVGKSTIGLVIANDIFNPKLDIEKYYKVIEDTNNQKIVWSNLF